MAGATADRSRATTRAEVARLAGVSTAVVSYVVNGGPRGVAPATRERVLRAIEVLDYRPNSSARALRRGKTHLLGVVVPDIVNPFHAEFVGALDAAASRRDRSILLAITHQDPEREFKMITDLIDRGVDALLILTYLFDKRSYTTGGSRIRRVIMDESSLGLVTPIVGPDLWQGAEAATSHLISHGHTRIGYVAGDLPTPRVDFRRMAWQSVLARHGLSTRWESVTGWTRRDGYDGARALLELSERPTAIFAASDLVAIGVLQALHDLGLNCPADVAVVSLDGTTESQFSIPPLTTVRQPFENMASAAIEEAVGTGPVPDSKVFEMELVIRRSCGCDEGVHVSAPASTQPDDPTA